MTHTLLKSLHGPYPPYLLNNIWITAKQTQKLSGEILSGCTITYPDQQCVRVSQAHQHRCCHPNRTNSPSAPAISLSICTV
jgi:hypothetical protein